MRLKKSHVRLEEGGEGRAKSHDITPGAEGGRKIAKINSRK